MVTSLLNNISVISNVIKRNRTERNRKKECSSGKSKNEKLRKEELHWGRNIIECKTSECKNVKSECKTDTKDF